MKPSVRLIRVILDTNILFSALHSGGPPLALLEMCMKHQRLIACVSTALLYEYEEVLKGKLPEINQSRKVKGWGILSTDRPFCPSAYRQGKRVRSFCD